MRNKQVHGVRRAHLYPIHLLLFVFFGASNLSAQGGDARAWDLHYDLEQGESVTYRVVSLDSIVIWAETPQVLLRQRVERITYLVDTVLPDGYGMRMTLNDVLIREKFDTLPWVTRKLHPWTGTSIYFVMDRQGQRLRLRDTLDAPGAMPGAPFQPLLIPNLGPRDTLTAGAGSVFDRKMWLLENTYPPVEFTGGVMRKIKGTSDTLGRKTMTVELSETGQVWYIPPVDGPGGIRMHARVNGAGNYLLDEEGGFPVVGDYQQISKLTLTDPQGENEKEGRQTISMIFHIDELGEELDAFMDREGLEK